MARIVCLGEGMLELSRAGGPGAWTLGHGGDTLNMAIHLARRGHRVSYFTALGTDPFSQTMIANWRAEGLDTALVLTQPARQPGLYAITTDEVGERTFTYWRENSAAREVFALPDAGAAVRQAAEADLLVLSLISLAILPDEGRRAALALAARVRGRGGKVAFDGNYRPRLWDTAATATYWRDAMIAHADIGLPTLDDETALSGERTARAVAGHWQRLGCGEVVVKLGAAGCLLPDGTTVPPPVTLAPVDTSGAGDAFNAGYIDARMRGETPQDAAASGHALAGWTIMRPGAIPSLDS